MNAMIEPIGEQRSVTAPTVREKSLLDGGYLGWLLLIFIMGSYLLFGEWQLRVLGILLVGAYILNFLFWRGSIAIEVTIFFGWILWSLVGYLMNAHVDTELYMKTFRLVFQVVVICFAIAGIAQYLRNLTVIFLGFAVGGLLLLLYSMSTGELHRAAEATQEFRAGGIMGQANQFANSLVFTVAAGLFFWGKRPSMTTRVSVAALVVLAVMGIISSGSRQAFVAFTVLIIGWLWSCYRKEVMQKPYFLVATILLLGSLYLLTDYMLSNTFMGERFHRDFVAEQGKLPQYRRLVLYQEGFDLLRKYPISGVGLGNFRKSSVFGLSSHSDYIEVAASTGIIGFVIYFSIYVLVWRRLSGIQNRVRDPSILYNVRLLKAITVTLLVIGFTRPNFTSILAWTFLASAIGYARGLQVEFNGGDACT